MRDRVIPVQVTQISPEKDRFRLTWADGRTAAARRVVLATVDNAPQLPDWVNAIPASTYPPVM